MGALALTEECLRNEHTVDECNHEPCEFPSAFADRELERTQFHNARKRVDEQSKAQVGHREMAGLGVNHWMPRSHTLSVI
jgi:hypothetical protein